MRYLRAGILDVEYLDLEHPHRSSKSLSCMFWNLGNWQRKTHSKNPVPEHLEKLRPHIRFDLNTDHQPIRDKPLYNNYFVTAIKNLRAHIFLTCEASSLYENRELLEESGWRPCFNNFTDLMCAARLGKDGYITQIAGYSTDDDDTKPRFVSWAIFEIVWGKTLNRSTNEEEPLTRARMFMNRVCVYHVGQNHVSRAAAMCGEMVATMCWECVRFEVDIIAGDGNKAAYYCTPKPPGVPTLLQFWIDRMVHTATQARIQKYGPSPKVRAKHFSTCSYNDLVHLNHHLRNIKTETYTAELAKKTDGYGDCCMLTMLEWGHARNNFSEDVNDFADEGHMDQLGEFTFQVNEVCLHGDYKSVLLSQDDNNSHNPMLVHFTPSEMTWNEARQYVPWQTRQARSQKRKKQQKANKRKAFQG